MLRDGFAYYDPVRNELLRFDPLGREIGTSAIALRGHDSLRDVRDVRLLPDGRVAILNAKRGALVILSSDWASATIIKLGVSTRVEQFIPLGQSGYMLWTFESDSSFAQVDLEGTSVARYDFPLPAYKELHVLARSGKLAGGSDGSWAFTFSTGDGWFPYNGTVSHGLKPYIESVAFPAVVERTAGNRSSARVGRFRSAAQAAVVHGGVLHVLFGGKTDLRGRLIDEYRMSDGAYLKSRVAPAYILELAADASGLYAFTSGSITYVLSPRGRR